MRAPDLDPSTMSSSFTEHLQGIRQDLIDNGMYLGDIDNAFRQEVIWRHVGNGKRLLVTKESADTVDEKQKADAMAPVGVVTTTGGTTSGVEDGANSPSTTESSTENGGNAEIILVPAQLSVILMCSQEDCWLTPCDFWRGPTKHVKQFADLKISFVGDCPPDKFQPFSEDFCIVRENITWLTDQVKVEGAECQGFIVRKSSANIALKFRHILFKVSSLDSL